MLRVVLVFGHPCFVGGTLDHTTHSTFYGVWRHKGGGGIKGACRPAVAVTVRYTRRVFSVSGVLQVLESTCAWASGVLEACAICIPMRVVRLSPTTPLIYCVGYILSVCIYLFLSFSFFLGQGEVGGEGAVVGDHDKGRHGCRQLLPSRHREQGETPKKLRRCITLVYDKLQ